MLVRVIAGRTSSGRFRVSASPDARRLLGVGADAGRIDDAPVVIAAQDQAGAIAGSLGIATWKSTTDSART